MALQGQQPQDGGDRMEVAWEGQLLLLLLPWGYQLARPSRPMG
jgi:hypothetical protein